MVFPGPVFDILCSHLGPDVPVLLALQAGLDKFQPLDAVIDIGVGEGPLIFALLPGQQMGTVTPVEVGEQGVEGLPLGRRQDFRAWGSQ